MEGKNSHKRSTGRRTAVTPDTPVISRWREYRAVLFAGTAMFLLLCLISYDPRDPSLNVATTRGIVSNWCGVLGAHVADALVQLLGLSALVVPVGLAVLALRLLIPPRSRLRWLDYMSLVVALANISALLERFSAGSFSRFAVQHPGGAVGTFLHASVFKYLGSAGEVVLSLTLVLICALHLSGISVRTIVATLRALGERAAALAALVSAKARESWERRQEEFAMERAAYEAQRVAAVAPPPGPAHVAPEADVDLREIGIPAWERLSCLPQEELRCGKKGASRAELSAAAEPVASREGAVAAALPWRSLPKDGNGARKKIQTVSERELEEAIAEYLREEAARSRRPAPIQAEEPPADRQSTRPIRVTRRADAEPQSTESPRLDRVLDDDYVLPSADLLDPPPTETRAVDEKMLEDNAAVLEQKLLDLGIKGEVVEVHPGPVITMYELTLAPGIPLRKVLSTCDDLAMALKCGSTRVVAPIHGKDTVGIEVPNLNREIVYFREIIESAAFAERTAPLKLALGKCIDGEPFATSLTRMPHLLIAGATGTGKSVGLNVMISSWLMTCHPDDVKFLMVDPKKLELSYYQDIPHLIHPVVTEAEKVPKVLSWAIREMERRYDLLSQAGAKNIEGYNEKVRNAQPAAEGDEMPPQKLPYIVIIIDELAELMMVAAKDIEISIARLAQMARASGIHLILATQRPSVDVITGVIKANFPARISYQVSAKPDSRTILDTTGAEHLLGMGDMLFLPPGTAKMRRLHGAYVSEDEIRRIVDFIKAQRAPVYLQEISNHVAEDDGRAAGADLIDDTKYDEAVELVARLGHASISLIQRHMRIGYNRAARIIEAMEAEGIIGPSDGTSRPREVLARSMAHIPDTLV